MSLSKHFSQGALSPKKPTVVNTTPRNLSYKNYLFRGGKQAEPKPASGQKQITLKSPTKPKRSNKRSNKRSSRKNENENPKKSLLEVESQIETLKRTMEHKAVPVKAKAVPVPVKAKAVPVPVKAKSRTRRSNRRSNRPPPRDKGRHISLKKRPVSPDELRRIEQRIQSVRTKKIKDIKSALQKEGIKVSGKSDRLLKDIYFYSKVCNIQITHEA